MKEIDKCRNKNDTKSKSKWEKELIDKVKADTCLLDLKSYTDICHLYDYRNFSAHPAINDNYELISPTKEETIALINNMLTDLLVKPPVFIKNVTTLLLADLSERTIQYFGKFNMLKDYLNNKYFDRMSLSMLQQTYKAFWKFCFILTDDENCDKNRVINRKALQIMFEHSEEALLEFIKNDKYFQSVSSKTDCLLQLIIYIANYPTIYKVLSTDTKLQIDNQLKNNPATKFISWFKSNKKSHAIMLQNCFFDADFSSEIIEFAFEKYNDEGLHTEILDLFIAYFGSSSYFDSADRRYQYAISPYLRTMSRSQIIKLIESIDNNYQIFKRRQSYTDNTEIVMEAHHVLGDDFDFSKYSNFTFDASKCTGAKIGEDSADESQEDYDFLLDL